MTPSPKVSDEPISAERLRECEFLFGHCGPENTLESVTPFQRAGYDLLRAYQRLRSDRTAADADARDAGRWRLLREHHSHMRTPHLTIAEVGSFELAPWSGDNPDRAIDAQLRLSASSAGE